MWGFGFTLIGLGGTMLRSAFMSAVMGSAGGAMGSGAAMSPDMLETYVARAFSTTRATNTPGTGPAPPKEVVKVKCRNCGNLEMEDAAFCRKYGEPL